MAGMRCQLDWLIDSSVEGWRVKIGCDCSRDGAEGGFRLRSYEAINKWYAVVFLVFVYWYWHSYESKDSHSKTTSLSEVLARLRHEHQRAVLRAACEEASSV